MTFLNPLDALIPKIPFSFLADFWVWVTSGARGSVLVGFWGSCQLSPFLGGGSGRRALSTPPPPPANENPASPMLTRILNTASIRDLREQVPMHMGRRPGVFHRGVGLRGPVPLWLGTCGGFAPMVGFVAGLCGKPTTTDVRRPFRFTASRALKREGNVFCAPPASQGRGNVRDGESYGHFYGALLSAFSAEIMDTIFGLKRPQGADTPIEHQT